jgi:hypothetical protein
MEDVYNVEWDEKYLIVTKGDTIDLSFSVAVSGVAYDMTGMQIDMRINDKDGTTLKSLSTSGTSGFPAEITISTTTFNVTTAGLSKVGLYLFDAQIKDGTDIITFLKGNINVMEETTLVV